MRKVILILLLAVSQFALAASGLNYRSRLSDHESIYYDIASGETLDVISAAREMVQDFELPVSVLTTGSITTATGAIRPLEATVVNSGTFSVVSASATLSTGAALRNSAELGYIPDWYAGRWLLFEARVAWDDAVTAVNIGVSDASAEADGSIALTCASTLINSTATNCALFYFDSEQDAAGGYDYINAVSVSGDTDKATATVLATHIDTDAEAQTWRIYRIEINRAGTVDFYLDGSHVHTIPTGISTTAPLTPYIAIQNREAAAHEIRVDYVKMWQGDRN